MTPTQYRTKVDEAIEIVQRVAAETGQTLDVFEITALAMEAVEATANRE